MRIEINDKNPGELVIIGEHELDFMRMEKVFMKSWHDYQVWKNDLTADGRFKLIIDLKDKEK